LPKPIVLIVGKPNVGKSTIFNRIIGQKKSIVLDFPGVTRDHVYGEARWDKRAFTLIDTCGIFENPEDIIEKQQKENVIKSFKEAAVVLFVVDGKNGLTSEDYHVADFLRKSGAKVMLVANKAESFEYYTDNILPELYSLGFGEPFPVSGEHNKNVTGLVDAVFDELEKDGYDTESEENIPDNEYIKIAIIGKPNAGKSSLFNAIIGDERVVVSDIPGTTRDSVDHVVEYKGKKYLFIDTAGMRKKSTVEYGSIEMYSIVRTIDSIDKSDVVISLIDAEEGITNQDQKVSGVAENRGKGTVIVFNKIDILEDIKSAKNDYTEKIKKEMYFVDYSPVVFTSATKKWGIDDLFEAIDTVYENTGRRVSTSLLNAALERHVMLNPPPSKNGKKIKFYFVKQVGVRPPVFTFYTNMPKDISKSYQQSLRNMIRKYVHDFTGSPLFIKFEEKNN